MPLLIIRQDITKTACDVIVNATNRHMSCDVGVSKAILDAAGEELLSALTGTINTGEVRVTPAFGLHCKALFHVVGPIWRGGEFHEKELLALCYQNILNDAAKLGARSIAIPLISSGSRGFPKKYVLDIAVETIAAFLMREEMDVFLVVYDKNSYSISKELFGDIKEFINDNYVDESEERDHARYIRYMRDMRAMRDEYIPSAADISLIDRGKAEKADEDSAFEETRPLDDRASYSSVPADANFRHMDAYLAPALRKIHPRPSDEAYLTDIQRILKYADDNFAKTLFKLIDARHMSDVECYKKANVSRQTWHKIISDENYRPGKTTVIAFAIALQLNLEETKHLLETVGYALSKCIKFDVIIEYCVENEIYDVYKINDVLYKFDQPLLGV